MKILILGQIPPPFGGQAINIHKMLVILKKHDIGHHFIRMNFSDELSEMGAFHIKKTGRLLLIFLNLLKQLITYRPDFVYYPPAGSGKMAILRDMVLLFPVRLFRFRIIFHFHAGGVSETYSTYNGLLKAWYRFTYYYADHAICLSKYGTRDPLFLRSKNIILIPSGVEDNGHAVQKKDSDTCVALFVGVCKESKGILDFIGTVRTCRKRNGRISGKVLGQISSAKEQSAIETAVAEGIISYEGVCTGEEKIRHFQSSDILLFPTFFEAENFPTVILEAFSYGLPVVATAWRGIPDQVTEGRTGFLHPLHDTGGMAASVTMLAENKSMYRQIAANARRDFETRYTMDIFEQAIITHFKSFR